ncbi:MAG: T9SS type A sorting domain-containing protein [bacterium]|nr:T9SS type A sorting domain-containing protein [bacterium]
MKCDFLQTRILSVFNLLKRVGFAVLLLGGAAQSQPQIDWREARMIDADVYWHFHNIAVSGDTLLFVKFNEAGRPVTCFSYDNGLTHGDWIEHGVDEDRAYNTVISTSANWSYVFWEDDFPSTMRAEASSNAGSTWQPQIEHTGAWPLAASTSASTTVLVYSASSSGAAVVKARWAIDGTNWGTSQTVDTFRTEMDGNDVTLTATHTLISAIEVNTNMYDDRIHVARGSRTGIPWTQFEVMPNQPYAQVVRRVSLASDTTSENVVLASVWERGVSGFGDADVFVTHSPDGGESWETPQQLTEGAPISWASYDDIKAFCKGNLYGLAWSYDTADDIEDWSLNFRYSANHGRFWYPAQEINSFVRGTRITTGQFVGSEVRVYWDVALDSNFTEFSLRTVSGLLTPDTLSPELENLWNLPEIVSSDTTLELSVLATDDDSLWSVEFVAYLQGAPEVSSIVVLEHLSSSQFEGFWTVPADTAMWVCFYRAEDLWENVATTLPETLFVGTIQAGGSTPTIVNKFSLSAFPNPFNSTLSISLDVPLHRDVTLGLYDLLGREVDVVYRGRLSSSTVSYVAPAAMASGVYFLRASANSQSVLGKVVLLK